MEKGEQFLSTIEKINSLSYGGVIQVNIFDIQPSQINDFKPSSTERPIEVCLENGMVLIVHGNHRYWDVMDNTKGDEKEVLVLVKKVKNPYEM